jgi:low temperature requirement protein LtrA
VRLGSSRRASGRLASEGERHASWLELFFDLVFVVAITELSRVLVADHSGLGFLRFAALFFPVFVAWQGYMAYATRFDTDDLGMRIAYFAGMLAIAALAVQIEDVAHGRHTWLRARLRLAALDHPRPLRTCVACNSEARRPVRSYGLGYAAGVAIWIVSLAFDTPWRYVLWIGAGSRAQPAAAFDAVTSPHSDGSATPA